MRVTIVGAGRVGLTTALALDHLGHDVVCVDNNEGVLGCLSRREMPFPDPDLAKLLRSSGLSFASELTPELVSAPVVMLAVPTPPAEDGHADLTAIHVVAKRIAEIVPDDARLLIVLKSTVPPGTTAAVQAEVSEILAKRGSTASVSTASNPEFLAQGTALADTFYPDRIVIGVSSQADQDTLRELYDPMLKQDFEPPPSSPRPAGFGEVPLISTKPVNAELTKYAANTFLATKLSFINEVGRLAEKLGGDVSDVAEGIGLDQRIGSAYLRAGPGWGGPCLGKDTRALVAAAEDVGAEMPVLSAVIQSNTNQREHIVDRLELGLGSITDKTIGLLGLSFKAGTDDTIDSPALDVAERLLARGAIVRSYDPLAEGRAMRERPDLQIQYQDSAEEVFEGCDALVLMTDWPEFREITWAEASSRMQGKLVVDARNFLDASELAAAGLKYVGIGR